MSLRQKRTNLFNLLVLISWVAFAMGIIAMWLAGKYRVGWLISALATIPWSIYAIGIGAYAVLANTLIIGAISCRNYLVSKSP